MSLEQQRWTIAINTGIQLAKIIAIPYFIVDVLSVKLESSIIKLNPCSKSVAVSPKDMPMSKMRILRKDIVIKTSNSWPAQPLPLVFSGKIWKTLLSIVILSISLPFAFHSHRICQCNCSSKISRTHLIGESSSFAYKCSLCLEFWGKPCSASPSSGSMIGFHCLSW